MKKFTKVRNFSALEVANICGVVNQTAINWIRKKYLKAFTTPGGQYRVYGEDLALFMAARGMKLPVNLQHFINQKSRTILFIEDDDQFAWRFIEEVSSEYPECSVERAMDSFEAGCKLANNSIDLILINSDMTGLNAEKVCRLIRSENNGENISIIVFTGSADSTQKESMLNAGADVYIKKPFDIGQISIYLE